MAADADEVDGGRESMSLKTRLAKVQSLAQEQAHRDSAALYALTDDELDARLRDASLGQAKRDGIPCALAALRDETGLDIGPDGAPVYTVWIEGMASWLQRQEGLPA